MNMEKQTIITVMAVVAVIFTAYGYATLYEENQTLKQEYEWAMEMAKMDFSEREDVVLKVKEQLLI